MAKGVLARVWEVIKKLFGFWRKIFPSKEEKAEKGTREVLEEAVKRESISDDELEYYEYFLKTVKEFLETIDDEEEHNFYEAILYTAVNDLTALHTFKYMFDNLHSILFALEYLLDKSGITVEEKRNWRFWQGSSIYKRLKVNIGKFRKATPERLLEFASKKIEIIKKIISTRRDKVDINITDLEAVDFEGLEVVRVKELKELLGRVKERYNYELDCNDDFEEMLELNYELIKALEKSFKEYEDDELKENLKKIGVKSIRRFLNKSILYSTTLLPSRFSTLFTHFLNMVKVSNALFSNELMIFEQVKPIVLRVPKLINTQEIKTLFGNEYLKYREEIAKEPKEEIIKLREQLIKLKETIKERFNKHCDTWGKIKETEKEVFDSLSYNPKTDNEAIRYLKYFKLIGCRYGIFECNKKDGEIEGFKSYKTINQEIEKNDALILREEMPSEKEIKEKIEQVKEANKKTQENIGELKERIEKLEKIQEENQENGEAPKPSPGNSRPQEKASVDGGL